MQVYLRLMELTPPTTQTSHLTLYFGEGGQKYYFKVKSLFKLNTFDLILVVHNIRQNWTDKNYPWSWKY